MTKRKILVKSGAERGYVPWLPRCLPAYFMIYIYTRRIWFSYRSVKTWYRIDTVMFSTETAEKLLREVEGSIRYFSTGSCVDYQQTLKLESVTQSRLDILKRVIDDLTLNSASLMNGPSNTHTQENIQNLSTRYKKFFFFSHLSFMFYLLLPSV